MSRILAVVLAVVLSLFTSKATASNVVMIPAKPQYAPTVHLCTTDENGDYVLQQPYTRAAAIVRARAEFDELFNSYDVKRAKNGAMMIRTGNTGSYKFCKRG